MNFLGGSFRVGRLFGVDLRVHVLFLVWIAFSLVTAGQRWRSEALFLGLLFGIVLLHEFGHCFGARAVGGYAENILMWPLGGLAYAHAPMRPWPQFVTVAAGPLVNVLLCLLAATTIFILSGGTLLPGVNPLNLDVHLVREASTGTVSLVQARWFPYLLTFYHVNLWLLAFNLLPIYPLDGGQLFHAILWPFLGLQRATVVACQVGLVGAVLLAFWSFRRGGGNMLLFIAIFGGMTCWQRLQAAKHGMIVEDPAWMRYDRGARRGFWSRLFSRRPKSRPPGDSYGPVEFPNPNPGGWAARQAEEQRKADELDRILQKVSEHGIQSLSYVERQTLERITRERQARERELQRDTRT